MAYSIRFCITSGREQTAMNLPTVVVCSCQASNAAPTAYATDPTKPIASIKEAWEGAKKRAGMPIP